MQVFSRDELELMKLEAARKKIADLRDKLRYLKQITTKATAEEPSLGHSEAEIPDEER